MYLQEAMRSWPNGRLRRGQLQDDGVNQGEEFHKAGWEAFLGESVVMQKSENRCGPKKGSMSSGIV